MSFDVPNLTLLRQFVVAAEEQGISRAANRLRLSQPALSKNIRKLEDMLDVQLFERHSNGARLTEAGRLFFDHAQIIGLEYQHALQNIRNMLSDQESTIRIGAGPIWSSTILPKVAERFHVHFPRHRLQVQTGSLDELAENLHLGRIDIYAGAILQGTTRPGFAVRELASSEMVVLAAEDHPLVESGTAAAPPEIAEFPFVAFSPSRSALESLSTYMKSQGAPLPKIMLESGSIIACIALVRTGKYLIYETRMVAESPIGAGLVVIPLPEMQQRFDIGIVYREGLDRIPTFRKLMQIMEECLGSTV